LTGLGKCCPGKYAFGYRLFPSMKLMILFIGIWATSSCGQQTSHIDNKWLPHKTGGTVIVLQPLSYQGKFLTGLKDSIPKYYPVTVNIAAPVNLPGNAFYAPRNRYKADTILNFIQQIKPAGTRLIVGITGKDISTRKGNNADYGIMGFGFQPGYACVVSIFRLQGDNPTEKLLFQRLLKTVLHEMGHNFGLAHCPNKHCIMADAKGELNQDNETGLCDVCQKKLNLQP